MDLYLFRLIFRKHTRFPSSPSDGGFEIAKSNFNGSASGILWPAYENGGCRSQAARWKIRAAAGQVGRAYAGNGGGLLSLETHLGLMAFLSS